MPKGEKLIVPKQKNRTTTHFQKKIVSQRGRNYSNYKNPLQLRGEFLQGEYLFSQREKAFETVGEFSKS
jgi:hypothetical protein